MHAGKLDGAQGWSVATNDLNQWMEIDVGQLVLVSGVVTQGRRLAYYYMSFGGLAQWVTKYRVSVSADGSSWTMVHNGAEFEGNSDNDTPVRRLFETPVLARYVRIMPTEWVLHITMRAAVVACVQEYDIQSLVRPSPCVVSHNCFYYTSKPECAIPDDKNMCTATHLSKTMRFINLFRYRCLPLRFLIHFLLKFLIMCAAIC